MLSVARRQHLQDVYDHVISVEELDSCDPTRLSLLGRPSLGITFTKLHAWALTQYKKCVFLDADTLVVAESGVDELFERPSFSAAPDTGWPDCFNSGVFVFAPSLDTHAQLLARAATEGSFDGGDQGLLNEAFPNWSKGEHRLPFIYNVTANASYSYTPAYARYGRNAKIVHFIGAHKPWHGVGDNGGMGGGNEAAAARQSLVLKWWHCHDDYASCCSESAPYKTVVNAPSHRVPGPAAKTSPVPTSSPHGIRRQAEAVTGGGEGMAAAAAAAADDTVGMTANPEDFTQAASWSDIQARLDAALKK